MAAASTSSSRTTRTRLAQSRCAFGTAGHGEGVDAQRLPAGGRREDVEEPRQLHHHPRAAGDREDWRAGLARRGAAPRHAAHPLPPADRLDREALEEAEATLLAWRRDRRSLRPGAPDGQVLEALADDLNTAAAIARLHRLDDPAVPGGYARAAGLQRHGRRDRPARRQGAGPRAPSTRRRSRR